VVRKTQFSSLGGTQKKFCSLGGTWLAKGWEPLH
jgi:hypothetical protein